MYVGGGGVNVVKERQGKSYKMNADISCFWTLFWDEHVHLIRNNKITVFLCVFHPIDRILSESDI